MGNVEVSCGFLRVRFGANGRILLFIGWDFYIFEKEIITLELVITPRNPFQDWEVGCDYLRNYERAVGAFLTEGRT